MNCLPAPRPGRAHAMHSTLSLRHYLSDKSIQRFLHMGQPLQDAKQPNFSPIRNCPNLLLLAKLVCQSFTLSLSLFFVTLPPQTRNMFGKQLLRREKNPYWVLELPQCPQSAPPCAYRGLRHLGEALSLHSQAIITPTFMTLNIQQ